jgi:5-formyltetrahydrofolate cyclo-ligase
VAAGHAAAARIEASEEFARARRVVLYAALSDELPVGALAEAATRAGKALLWPRVRADGEIEVAAAERGELVPDAAGALAPSASCGAVVLERGDLLVVPGLAFARDGARLGRGGGHYDRLLARAQGCVSIGVAFDIQLEDRLPMEPHDRRVDLIATPTGMWRTLR